MVNKERKIEGLLTHNKSLLTLTRLNINFTFLLFIVTQFVNKSMEGGMIYIKRNMVVPIYI